MADNPNSKQDMLARLETARMECDRLREENARLKEHLGISEEDGHAAREPMDSPVVVQSSSTEAKLALFRSLFRGRKDVYAVRWENTTGRSGYSPAYTDKWGRVRLGKPRTEYAESQSYLPVTDQVIHDHLTGKHTVGIYPLIIDETCWFLAADFDKATWQEDAAAFLETCNGLGVPAALERSRSGNGGHVWIFFERPAAASLARRLGCAILTRTMEQRHQIGLDSYDRFFPSQDTMPKGGFGNLIALPLQRGPRDNGNSVFLDADFEPFPDQWAFLSQMKRMSAGAADALVTAAMRSGRIIGVRMSLTDPESEDDPWTLPPSGKRPKAVIEGLFPEALCIVHSNMVFVEKEGLPSAMLNSLVRLAAFQNPEFYKAQAMRLSTFGKARVIGCAEESPRHIALPRGCLDEAVQLLQSHGVKVDVTDKRFQGVPVDVSFKGMLRPLQQQAVDALLKHDCGVLSAPTGFGKTVIAAWLIAARQTNTLVVVHRRQLMDQWREQLALFFDVSPKTIGQIGGGKQKRTGAIDIGIMQSLNRKGVVKDLVAEYGQVIVDECHHVSAFSFEQVLKQVKARYVAGLTATPIRKDGHHPIITMQCGPIRHRVSAKEQAAMRPFEHKVISRMTNLNAPEGVPEPGIQDLYAAIINDKERNDLIFDDILKALEAGRSPIFLTERIKHVREFAERLSKFARNVIVLKGGMGAKQRQAVAEQIVSIPDTEERILIATGRYIGEGFDDARLDTLFLAMPISWRGTLQQYAGRLHRLHDNKREVKIYDYVDAHIPMLMRMYEKRVKGYKAIGYEIE